MQIFDYNDLSSDDCESYYHDVVARGCARGGGEVHRKWIYRRLRILELIYFYRSDLINAGLPALKVWPFPGTCGFTLARRAGIKESAGLLPFADRFAITVMNRANFLLATPADDIIRLTRAMVEAFASVSRRNRSIHDWRWEQWSAVKRVAAKFRFSCLPGSRKPWHPRLVDPEYNERTPVRPAGGLVYKARRLIALIESAASVCIQSGIGIRASESCSLRAGIDEVTGLPKAVEVRISQSGLNEVFFIKGYVSKLRSSKNATEWIAGLRPRGEHTMPPPIRAIYVLEELFCPFRKMSGSKRLLLSLPRVRFLDALAGRYTTIKNNENFQRFARYVLSNPLPGEVPVGAEQNVGRMVSHRWRPTWAHFLFKIDARFMHEIKNHLKHLSLAMTEQAYIGNDPELLEAIDDVRVTETTRFFYEAATGLRSVYGGMAKLVREHEQELRSKCGLQGAKEMREWVVTHDLRLWFMDEGKCFINFRPEEARCHQLAGTTHWNRLRPNYATRSVEVCLGCACFATDVGHRPFWEERRDTNRRAFAAAVVDGRESEFEIARARALQAEAILVAIDKRPH